MQLVMGAVIMVLSSGVDNDLSHVVFYPAYDPPLEPTR